MIVLGEGTHLGGGFAGVEAQHFLDHQGVGDAMGQVMERAQLVGHGVAHAQEGVGEGHTGHGGGVGHILSGSGVSGAVLIGGGQILEDQLQRPQCHARGRDLRH